MVFLSLDEYEEQNLHLLGQVCITSKHKSFNIFFTYISFLIFFKNSGKLVNVAIIPLFVSANISLVFLSFSLYNNKGV